METKQTTVDWLKNTLEGFGDKYELVIPWDTFDEILERAKAMEKEQHGETWDKALDAYEGRGYLYVRAWEDFDHYYNGTYGK